MPSVLRMSTSMTSGAGLTPPRVGVLVDLGHRRGGGQQDGGCAVFQGSRHPMILHTELRHRKRHRDEAGLQRTEEGDDVVESLGSEDRCAVAGGTAPPQLLSHHQRSPVYLLPGQGLEMTCPEQGAVHEGVGRRIALHGGPLAQQCRNRHVGVGHAWRPLRVLSMQLKVGGDNRSFTDVLAKRRHRNGCHAPRGESWLSCGVARPVVHHCDLAGPWPGTT